jgi:hypothetical protein
MARLPVVIAHRFIVALIAGSAVLAGCAATPHSEAAGSQSIGPAVTPLQATWREQTVPLPDRQAFQATAGQSGLVVGDNTTWVEIEGGHWLPAETVDGTDRLGIVEWHGALVSWAVGGVVRVSRDGLSWSDALKGPGDSNLAIMVPFENQLLLLGEGVRTSVGAWRSVDGSAWTAMEGAPLGMKAAAAMPGRGLVAVGWSGPSAAVWKTADATTWERVAGPDTADGGTSALHGVAVNGSNVFAIGDIDGAAAAWSSDDLSTWTLSPSVWGEDTYLAAVAYLRGTFVIAGRRGDRPVVWRSADGRTWSFFDLPIAPGVKGGAVETTVVDDRLVVFGLSTQDAGNGGAFHTGYLVWTLEPPG